MEDRSPRSIEERSEETVGGATTDGEFPAVTCTLTGEQVERRKDWVAEHLLPHLSAVEEREDGYTFVFDRNPGAYEAVAEVAWKESQCCAWATFEVELPPGDGPIRWHERADRAGGKTLFGDAISEFAAEFETVEAARGRDPDVASSGAGRGQ